MKSICQKCDFSEKTSFIPIDRAKCPKCGVHGFMTAIDSKPFIYKGKIVGFVEV